VDYALFLELSGLSYLWEITATIPEQEQTHQTHTASQILEGSIQKYLGMFEAKISGRLR
jgi:hypothetical protein